MDQDTRHAFGDIKDALKHQSSTQGKIFDKVDETNKKLDQHVLESVERKGKIERRIDGVERTAIGADNKIDSHLVGHRWKLRWILGIVASVIAAVVTAIVFAFR